ncbi:MAG: endonuclease/exonuclease/phosphatase family protein [Bacillota bacterium]
MASYTGGKHPPWHKTGKESFAGTLPLLAAGALGIWMGMHAFRSLIAMVVWNVAEDMPAAQMGLIALSVYSLGLAARVPARFLGGPRPAWRFGALLALLTVARQALPGEILSPVLSFATGVVWLWWLPAFFQELAQKQSNRLAAPIVLGGLALQVAGQAAMHGLDLNMARGMWAVLLSMGQACAFALALWRAGGNEAPPDRTPDGSAAGISWGVLALGPYLFLQMTLLANLGRAGTQTGWETAGSAAFIMLSLLAGLAALAWRPSRPARIGLGLLAVFLLAPGMLPPQYLVWAFIPLQAALSLQLAASFAPGESPGRGRVYSAAAGGAMLLFLLMFAYYSRYGWPLLWPAAAALVAVGGIRAGRTISFNDIRAAIMLLGISIAGIGLSLVPFSRAVPSGGPAPTALKVFNYNIHHGFDTWGVPSIQAVAGAIEESGADIVSLQEVNRGWNLCGGIDIVAYLRWRFPGYHVVYGPMNGDLWGNLIMSRHPVSQWGFGRYTPRKSDFPRGFTWVKIPSGAGELLFVTTHYSAYQGFDEDRISQSAELLELWRGRPRTVIAGDFNALPEDQAVKMLKARGLKDIPAQHGLGQTFTFSAAKPYERIDYIFGSPDVESLAAQVPRITYSDHLPVTATVVLR